MAQMRPYLFCRYSLLQNEEPLDARGQLHALQELQSGRFANGPTAEREGRLDTVVMRPRSFRVDGQLALTWSVGQMIETQDGVRYDQTNDRLMDVAIDASITRYNDFVAIPELNVVAVDDRTSGNHLGGKGAIRRFRYAFQNFEGGAAQFEMTITQEDLDEALDNWHLERFWYKVRPANPHARSELSQNLSESMRREGIGSFRGHAEHDPDQEPSLRLDGGRLAEAYSLAMEGYGQIGLRGNTPEGHVATIPRAQFQRNRERNQRIQDKSRPLRVHIESDGETESDSFADAVRALMSFYVRDE